MRIADLNHVLRIFRGGELEAPERETLFKEVLLMTLARATDSDSNITTCEVETVRKILKRITGADFSTADVRVAAASELYETAPLEKYLAGAARKLDARQRVTVVEALAEVIRSDVRITSSEVRFFNMVAGALALTPAELAGVIPENA